MDPKAQVKDALVTWLAANQSEMARLSAEITELDGPVREQLQRRIKYIGAGIESNRGGSNDATVEVALIAAVRVANNERHTNRETVKALGARQLFLRNQNKVIGRLIGELA